MFTSVASLRADLTTMLEATVPDTWRIRTAVAKPVESLVPVVYILFREFTTSDASGDLQQGVVSAVVDISITDPQKDDIDAENDVDDNILSILAALDPRPDLYWETATKERLDNGSLYWRVTVHALTATPTPE